LRPELIDFIGGFLLIDEKTELLLYEIGGVLLSACAFISLNGAFAHD
jgi:hypothetical protein